MSPKHSTCLTTSTVFTDSGDDGIALSTYVRDINDRSKVDSNLSTLGVSGYAQQQSRYSSTDYNRKRWLAKYLKIT